MKRMIGGAVVGGLLFSAAIIVAQSSEAQNPKQMLVTIPLKDEGGTVRANLNYRWNPGGRSAVYLVDVRSRNPVNWIPAEQNGASVAPLADLPPLRSEPYREPPGTFGRITGGAGLATGRSDTASDVVYLLGYVRHLEKRLKQVEQRINDTSRRG